jgi:adenylate cyclase
VPEGRLSRALTAFLRQEIQAPASAITDFIDILIEDASASQGADVLADLNRMRTASERLNGFIKEVINSPSSAAGDRAAQATFHRKLRHDLRTPLNAIKGYSELLLEDMDAQRENLRADLIKLKDSANQLLGQIDTMALIAGADGQEDALGAEQAHKRELVTEALRTVAPLSEPGDRTAVPSSRILVIDDNASNRDVLERRLSREGHRVISTATGASALSLLSEQEFDLILLDLIMPEMSGFEVLRRLKAAEHTRDIPVIVVSALDELDSVVRCIEAGADDYLTKPFNPTLLRARIGASLERKLLHDREQKFVADLEQEKTRSESLLLNILPQSIIARMREGQTIIADSITEATVLFCDLVGFTELSQQLTADRTIGFLSKIFSTLDLLAAEFGTEKIKTIGDAYMVAAGIPEFQSDHAERIARLAPRMLRAIAAVGETTDLKLQARIGIHTGPIVAGVIDTHKFAYDVWGETVNIASRMESLSLPGRIQVSDATRAALGTRFNFERRGVIEVKGIGMMETYFLVG